MKKVFFLRACYATVGCVLFTAAAALAQPGSGGPGPGGNPVAQVPLDGGVSLLLAAGGAYGLKRLRARRNAKK